MNLQVIDQRSPLSAAIALAKTEAAGLPVKWREEMAAMAAEVARKYFGALTEDAVRDGVEATVNLLSIGLLRASAGAIEPALWLQSMRASGVRGVSKLSVELIKACDALPDMATAYAGPDEFRPSLLLQLFSYSARLGAARAYAFLLRETAERAEVRRLIDLAEWLLAKTSSGRIIRRDLERFFGTETPDAEAAVHHVLTLACGVTKIAPFTEPSMLEDAPPSMGWETLPIHRLPARRLAEAQERYEALVAQIPGDLQAALVFRGVSWFERYIQPKSARRPSVARGDSLP